jgi:hypothetical protein
MSMTTPEAQTPEAVHPAHQLAAELQTQEAILNPNPDMYRAAGQALSGYFAGRLETGFSGEEDRDFTEVVDNVVSAFGALYNRDQATHRTTLDGRIGDNPADSDLINALKAASEAQAQTEAAGKGSAYHTSRETMNTLSELDYFRNVDISKEVGAKAGSPLRLRAVDTLRDATRAADRSPEAYAALAHVGGYAAEALIKLADITARHEKDTGSVGKWNSETEKLETYEGNIPLYKDYLADHVGHALELAYKQD